MALSTTFGLCENLFRPFQFKSCVLGEKKCKTYSFFSQGTVSIFGYMTLYSSQIFQEGMKLK